MRSFDLIVLGGGTAGMNLAHRTAAAGWKVALVEASHLGGTCINVGCIPSKTLISSARVMQSVRDAVKFGVLTEEPQADWTAMVARKDKLVERIRSRSYRNVEKKTQMTLYEGTAAFSGAHSLTVNGDEITADRIVIATGARTAVPELPGLSEIDYLTSTTAMELLKLPESLLILGGGIIALEFSQLFRRLGVEVTILQRDQQLASNLDADIAAEIRRILETEGVIVETGSSVDRVSSEPKMVFLEGSNAKGPFRFSADRLFVATGRTPNSDQLALDQTGVKTDNRGYIIVDERFRTNVEGIWAIGDVIGGMMFTHKAWHDALLLSRNFLEGREIASGNRLIPFAIFTEPEIAGVGLNEKAALAEGDNIKIHKFPFSFQGRARAIEKLDGFIKLIVKKNDGMIVGAQIIGPEAGELIHELIAAMNYKATVYDLQEMIHVHPTLSEAINNTAWSG